MESSSGTLREFERWIEDERVRISGLATEGGWSLAQSHLATGQKAEAARWAKWTASLQPADDASVQRALRLLQAAGDRSGGLEAYDRLRRHLSERSEPPPSEETVRLARELASSEPSDTGPLTLPKRSSQASAIATYPESTARSEGHTSRLLRALRRTPWLVVALAVTGFVTWTAWFRPQPTLDADLMVVVPFRVGGAHPSLAYLREGMIDLLAMGLTGEVGLRIVDPRSTLAAWRQLVRSEVDAPTPKAIELARRLGAGQVLLGEVVGSAFPSRCDLVGPAGSGRTGTNATEHRGSAGQPSRAGASREHRTTPRAQRTVPLGASGVDAGSSHVPPRLSGREGRLSAWEPGRGRRSFPSGL